MPDDPPKTAIPKSPPDWWRQLRPLAHDKREHPTPAEDWLWQRLRNRQVAGLKFKRQTAFGPFIVDFYCADHRLVIEVDGPIHASHAAEDAERTSYLESLGLRVLRFSNDQVLERIDDVLASICAFTQND